MRMNSNDGANRHNLGSDVCSFKNKLNELRLIVDSKEDWTYEQIDELFKSRKIDIPFVVGKMSGDKMYEFRFYRVRTNVGLAESITSPDTFSYRKETDSNGRANVAGHSVFYGCMNPGTAMLETNLSKDEVFYLSEWKLKGPIDHLKCISFINDNNNFPSMIKSTEKEKKKFILESFKSLDGHHNGIVSIMYEFINEVFVTEPPPYNLSSFFAHNAMLNTLVDIISYPSSKSNFTKPNHAISTKLVDKHFELLSVKKLIKIHDDPNDLNMRHIGFATVIDGEIVWQKDGIEPTNV